MLKGPEQMRYDNVWDACINQPRNRHKEKSRIQTESQIQGNNNASRRCQTNTASRRGQKDTVSRRDGTTLPLAEAGTLSPAETEQHCFSQRREGKQGKTKLLFPHRGTRDTFEKIRICWTLEIKRRENRDAFHLTRNSLDTLHPRDKRCHVCRDFTAPRCDHRANGYT